MPEGSAGPVSPRPRCDHVCERFCRWLKGNHQQVILQRGTAPDFLEVRERLAIPKLREVTSTGEDPVFTFPALDGESVTPFVSLLESLPVSPAGRCCPHRGQEQEASAGLDCSQGVLHQ